MNSLFPPAFIFLLAGLLIPFFKGRMRDVFLLLMPVFAFIQISNLPQGLHWTVTFLNTYELTLLKVEPIRLCFGYVFVKIGRAHV